MKSMMAPAVLVFLMASCRMGEEIQVQVMDVKLVEIDTLERVDHPVQRLVWITPDNMRYITVADLNENYSVGTQMKVLTKR
jgi:hypothetical protein